MTFRAACCSTACIREIRDCQAGRRAREDAQCSARHAVPPHRRTPRHATPRHTTIWLPRRIVARHLRPGAAWWLLWPCGACRSSHGVVEPTAVASVGQAAGPPPNTLNAWTHLGQRPVAHRSTGRQVCRSPSRSCKRAAGCRRNQVGVGQRVTCPATRSRGNEPDTAHSLDSGPSCVLHRAPGAGRGR